MLRIKKSRINYQWVVYNPKDFTHHTHCSSIKIAKIIRDNVCKQRVPKSQCIRLIESHIRLADDDKYIKLLVDRIAEITQQRGQRHAI